MNLFLKKIITSICPPFLMNIVRGWVFDESQIIYNGRSYRDFAEIAITEFRPKADEQERKHLLEEMKKTYIAEKFRPDEFLLYGFDKKDYKLRQEYISQRLKEVLIYQYYLPDSGKILMQLKNKYVFYTLAKPFFKREVFLIESSADWNNFKQFCKLHQQFIIKAIDKGCGVGIWKECVNTEKQAKELFEKLIDGGKYVVEELVIQEKSLASFNDSSVNTVRYPSFRHGNKIIGAFPFIRFGRKGSVVDNAGQGGLFASIDIATGKICTCGYDEKGHQFDVHPDSGVKIMDFQIPQWQELIKEAYNAHLSLPQDHTYVAFDYALTEKGWTLIEGNWGDFVVQQTSLQRGLRKEFIDLLEGTYKN